jgi:hypothetical protein
MTRKYPRDRLILNLVWLYLDDCLEEEYCFAQLKQIKKSLNKEEEDEN